MTANFGRSLPALWFVFVMFWMRPSGFWTVGLSLKITFQQPSLTQRLSLNLQRGRKQRRLLHDQAQESRHNFESRDRKTVLNAGRCVAVQQQSYGL